MKKLLGIVILVAVVLMPFNMMTVFAESFYVNHYSSSGSCSTSGFLVYGMIEIKVPPHTLISNRMALNGVLVHENSFIYDGDGTHGLEPSYLFPPAGFAASLPYRYEFFQAWQGYDGRLISLNKTEIFCSASGTLSVTNSNQHFNW